MLLSLIKGGIMALRSFQGIMPTLGERTYVDASAVIIGRVTIGADCSIWPMAVIRGDVHTIHIGNQTNLQDGAILHVTHPSEKTNTVGHALWLGAHITIGHRVTLHGCRILDRCLIGMDSTIMDGACIESDVMIGAKSLVPPGKTLTSGYLYIGSPVIQKRRLTTEEIDFIRYSAHHYAALKDKYLNEPVSLFEEMT